MQAIDRLNSNLALASALVLYPLLFRLITPRNASPSHFVRSREAISATHAVLISLASVLELYRQRDRWIPPALRSETGLKDGPSAGSQHAGQQPDIIHARCPFGNAIVAWECGYLAQDFVVLLLGARSTPAATDGRRSRSVMAKSFNWRVIGGHHLGLVTALSLFHLRALRGEAKGVLVVLMMFLMNLSTPIGTLHWYLAKFRPWREKAIAVTLLGYLAMYGLCRVYIVYWILRIYGLWTGDSAIAAFTRLPRPCKIGLSTIAGANTAWWIMGIRKFMRRHVSK